jgi:hypothetical protein
MSGKGSIELGEFRKKEIHWQATAANGVDFSDFRYLHFWRICDGFIFVDFKV